MYPGFIKVAEDEKKTDAVLAFTHAMKAEQVHAALYKKALDAIKAGHDLGRERSSSVRSAAISNSGRHRTNARSAAFSASSSGKSPCKSFFTLSGLRHRSLRFPYTAPTCACAAI